MKFDTFQHENQVIDNGEQLLNEESSTDFHRAYQVLLEEYKALSKISRRLVRMSDRNEETLREANQQLEIARDTAETAKEETRQFLAMISHELRTPLAILQNEVELLSDGIRQPTSDNLQSLQEEITHFTRLINDMFEISLSDINSLSYEKETIDLQELLDKTVSQFEAMFADKDIIIQQSESDNAMLYWGDSQRIRQVFFNILKNSCNYTNSSGKLRVNCRIVENCYIIEFSDSQPGLTDHALEKIFQRFFRGESSRNRATGGAGLGMAICQNIMLEHKGIIAATHSDLGGICIRLKFPMDEHKNSKLI